MSKITETSKPAKKGKLVPINWIFSKVISKISIHLLEISSVQITLVVNRVTAASEARLNTGVLSPTRKETSYSDRRFLCSYILFSITTGGILVLFIYITRLASNEILSRSNKIYREVGRAKDLSAPR